MRKLIFFHASWCPPCRFYEKQFIAPLEELVGAEHIERIDAWKEPCRATKYNVERLPTVVLLDGETVYMNRTGAIEIDKVAEWLKGEKIMDNCRPVELKDTVEMMNSDDYKERFKAEYCQTVIRYGKLKYMLERWDDGNLNFNPTCPRSTYNIQIKAMTDYIAILKARAVMEGIELPKLKAVIRTSPTAGKAEQ